MSEFAKGDYVVYIDEFGDGHYGRVAFVDERGMVHVCFTSGCITRPRKPEWLRKIEPGPWVKQVRFGQPRFDTDRGCPDYCPGLSLEEGGGD